ncbi:MAG: hypothetical protein EU547_05560 [Promethearchaeota archaeon]|nr:MAG: hypothetical protein EU547_05560 [Candidatus Lokiarchaeota archaeon]
MFFNKDPIFCIIIVGGAIGLYAFFRLRKKNGTSSGKIGGFFSRNENRTLNQNNNLNDLVIYMAMQQMLNSQQQNSFHIKSELNNEREENTLEREKEEIIKLLEEV